MRETSPRWRSTDCAATTQVRTISFTGPESLTQRDLVATIGEVLGRSLRLEELTPEEWLADLPDGMPPPVAKMLIRAWEGGMGRPAAVTSTVADVTARPARTFREWAVEHAALFL